MITIKYCPNGKPISDFKGYKWVNHIKKLIKNNIDKTVEISSEICILALRVEIIRGTIKHTDVVLEADNKLISFNEDSSQNYVFKSPTEDYLMMILKWRPIPTR